MVVLSEHPSVRKIRNAFHSVKSVEIVLETIAAMEMERYVGMNASTRSMVTTTNGSAKASAYQRIKNVMYSVHQPSVAPQPLNVVWLLM